MKVRFPVGDWSDDGHGKCNWYTLKIPKGKTVKDLEATLKKGHKRYPDISPFTICGNYEEYQISEDLFSQAVDLGCPDNMFEGDGPDQRHVNTDDMIQYVAWFLTLCGLETTWVENDKAVYTPWGLGHCGYGLFW